VAAACGGDDGTGTFDGSVRDGGGVRDGRTGVDARPSADGSSTDAPPAGDGGLSFACSLEELTPIAECARDNCVMLPDGGVGPDASLPDPGELAGCILTSCGTLLIGVSPECRNCLIAGVGMNLEEIAMACANGLPMLPDGGGA
jgi:hypothetical protein